MQFLKEFELRQQAWVDSTAPRCQRLLTKTPRTRHATSPHELFGRITLSVPNTEFAHLSLVTQKSKVYWLWAFCASWSQALIRDSHHPLVVTRRQRLFSSSQHTQALVWTWNLSGDVETSLPMLTGLWLTESRLLRALGVIDQTSPLLSVNLCISEWFSLVLLWDCLLR